MALPCFAGNWLLPAGRGESRMNAQLNSAEKHAHMGSSHRCGATLAIFWTCSGGYIPRKSTLNPSRYCQMHFSFYVLYIRNTFAAARLWGTLLLALQLCLSNSLALDPSESMAITFSVYPTGSSGPRQFSKSAAPLSENSDFTNLHTIRVSSSDLQSRLALERSFQLAAFQQFDSRRTGLLYNVSVPGMPAGSVRAIRLRSGSFRRYGVIINEFNIPRGCIVDPFPERILLVYAQFANRSLFQSVPGGFVLSSPVFSVLVYDAGNLNSSQTVQQIGVSTTASLIAIKFPQSSSAKCAQFASNTTDVNVTDLVAGECRVDHLGTFAFVSSEGAPTSSPSGGPSLESGTQKKHSRTWKIVVGSVAGGLTLLAVISLLALGVGKHRKNAKLSRMEYQAEQGETLQMATVRNSRVPAAGNTRTQATLSSDYTV